MSHNKYLKVPVKGMHCRSCELIIEEKLKEIPRVKKVEVNYKLGEAIIHYEGEAPAHDLVRGFISEAGYELGKEGRKPFFNSNIDNLSEVIIGIAILLFLYIVLRSFGLTRINFNPSTSGAGLGLPLMVGLIAGVSTCMALVGGLVLGLSTKFSKQHPQATRSEKFRPHLFFVGGRILGYALLGGTLGLLGSVFQLSSSLNATLTMLVGALMLFIGLQLINLFPRLSAFSFSLPPTVAKFFGINKHEREYSNKRAAILGGLTFFLPCGFTQAMQVFAISRGNFWDGAIIMGLFALGTAPGLLSVGGLTSTVKGSFKNLFFKTAGLAIVALSLFNISNGYTLLSTSLAFAGPADEKQLSGDFTDSNVKLENGVQVVRMAETNRGYAPNSFKIKKGVPVKWIVDAQDPYSCAASLIMPKIGINKSLKAGENVIEFTPKETGKLPFSCSMGMYTGAFIVYDESSKASDVAAQTKTAAAPKASGGGSCGSSGGGCGCGGGAKKPASTTNAAPVVATIKNTSGQEAVQVIKTVYTADSFLSPSTFKVKAGTNVKLEIDVRDDGTGCGYALTIPDLYDKVVPLQAGVPINIEFTPTTPGTYDITCSMHMIQFGTIIVE
jgi:sulfite exporter TauE/SafE/plastocyanin domain-containing protein/copper chaperone CopZ